MKWKKLQKKNDKEIYFCLNNSCQHLFYASPGPIVCPKCNGSLVQWSSFKYWDNNGENWYKK